MAITYLKKSPKTSSTDDTKTTEIVKNLLKEIEDIDDLNKQYDIRLSDPDQYKELIQKEGFFDLYEKNQRKKEKLEQDWEEAINKLDNIK